MKLRLVLICGIAGSILAGGELLAADSNPTNAAVTTSAVYVPDTSHQNEPLPDGVLAWSSTTLETNVAANAGKAHFTFNFSNVTTGQVAILDVHPGCHCTTTELPPRPWILPAGTNAQFGITVDVAGRTGTLFKTVNVVTDKGFKQLMVKINILSPVMPTQSDAERVRAMETAKADRQAVFHGDCVTCHVKPGEGKYGKPLYDAVCAICHDSKTRASMVPDLRAIKVPTNMDFWRTWIAHGKAGSLMPAFSAAAGGSLSEIQIASLAQYMTTMVPPQPPANK